MSKQKRDKNAVNVSGQASPHFLRNLTIAEEIKGFQAAVRIGWAANLNGNLATGLKQAIANADLVGKNSIKEQLNNLPHFFDIDGQKQNQKLA